MDMHALSKSMTLLVTVKINGGLSNGPNVKFNELSDDYSLLKSMSSSQFDPMNQTLLSSPA